MGLIRLLSFVLSFSWMSASWAAIDIAKIDQLLQSDGVVGWIHGNVQANSMIVFTYRDPNNFFDHVEFSLYAAPGKPEVVQALAQVKRHDKIRVFGMIKELDRSQPHIRATKIEMVEAWDEQLPEYQRQVMLPGELEEVGEFIGKVHAVVNGGRVVVLEYKDAIIPMPVKEEQLPWTKDLFRGDKVRVHFIPAEKPSRPFHIELNPDVAQPMEVMDHVLEQHGQEREFSGNLILFLQSPQINRNIFAVQVDVGDGVMRDYTLVNFEDPKEFTRILAKLQLAWDQSKLATINGRNKLIKIGLRLKARGMINVIDPNQANPQILLKDVDAIEFVNP